ncbi:sensor histidine kinase [Clostridium autoethanogenum]|uniref:histidine kinase n=2 Tax=Clostridium autoethanogenum TaxID=84023 RepID=A0A3M0S1D5_9CLOT|nr:HAMP domain-containing sensor histidine kinase [Clostridium autoethanogenum]AGY76759.1 HAMP domain-containing histidine kinase [Clostridium autoethanogenum DSM 10061]ALU36913.1 Histidine kinase [Clostridium autoethanogenum DSM 10061]OVY50397.1 Non-motile and phage-resistance protein [Clostridium autoethanogenum]RMC92366.1 sensor histidine kinase [Clostridium autoethanogenum]
MKNFNKDDGINENELKNLIMMNYTLSLEREIEELKNDAKKNSEKLNEGQELNKKILQFIYGLFHELKTPLNVIFSAAQVMSLCTEYKNEETLEKQSQYLKIIKQNCYRLMRLINNLQDLSKLDSGFVKLELHNRNIVSFVEDITLSLIPYVKGKGINLIFDTNVEEKIMALDYNKMERIVLNLLSNAIKFTPEKGTICIGVEDKDDNVYISVKDTGIGIPEDKFKFIFEKFKQCDKSPVNGKVGNGIGLYLVKCFAEMHGGKVSVKSTVGQGSTFTVKLPVKVIEEKFNKVICSENMDEQLSIEFSDICPKISQ